MPELDVPVAGKVDKRVVIAIGVGAAGYLGYRYWKARTTVDTGTPTDPGFEDPGVLPGVAGAVKPDNMYGDGSATHTSDTSQITTNAAWSQLALGLLDRQDKWPYATMAEALGNYLDGQPLSDEQQSIVRSAIAVAGHPPVGNPSIIPGGNTSVTVAPTGVAASGITPTSALINFVPVPGARTYNVYRNGSAAGTGNSTPITLDGLTPNTSYSVTVAAVSSSGSLGPKSSPITLKTSGVALATPNKPTVSQIQKDRATLAVPKIPYATQYRWAISGGGQSAHLLNTTDGPVVTATNLKSKTRYTVTVAADTSTGNPGKSSAAASFTTK